MSSNDYWDITAVAKATHTAAILFILLLLIWIQLVESYSISDDDLVLRNDMMMPSKEFIVAIRLCGVLVDLAKEPSNDEADS